MFVAFATEKPRKHRGRYVAESTKRSPNPGRFGGFAATDMAAAAELEPSLAPLR
jgi:hypothetical protein